MNVFKEEFNKLTANDLYTNYVFSDDTEKDIDLIMEKYGLYNNSFLKSISYHYGEEWMMKDAANYIMGNFDKDEQASALYDLITNSYSFSLYYFLANWTEISNFLKEFIDN